MSAADLHQDAFVVDAHSDILMDVRAKRRGGELHGPEDRVIERHHLAGMRAGGVDVLVLALYVEPHFREATLREDLLMIDDLNQEIAESDGGINLILTREDAQAAPNQSGLSVLLSLEGTEALAVSSNAFAGIPCLPVRVLCHQTTGSVGNVPESETAAVIVGSNPTIPGGLTLCRRWLALFFPAARAGAPPLAVSSRLRVDMSISCRCCSQ